MPNIPQFFGHISKKSKPNDTPVPARIFLRCQCPLTLSPPNLNPKNDNDQSLDAEMKSPAKRLFFEHSSRMLIDTPPNLNGSYRRFFVSLSPSNSLEKEEILVNPSSEPKEQIMKEVLALYPEEKFFESMVRMIRTRLECNLNVDSDNLEELLTVYLIHNDKSLYGQIFSAYLRMMVDMSKTFG